MGGKQTLVDTGLYIGPDNAPDRYRLLRSIGRGGEAVLYLAELELGGATEPVVVKVLDARQTLSRELFARISEKWREQAELLRFVHRLGVVGIREHFEGPSAHPRGALAGTAPGTGRALYLVMNHVDGLDLRDWRAERTLRTPAERREAVRCLEQLADVLDWLHSGAATPSGRTVVHGDLSPGNVMVDTHGQATLVDFGLSKLAADHRTAEVWFTPGFAAPEVYGGQLTPATDRYAFGALAYFLLSGETPAATAEALRAALLALPEFAQLAPDRAARLASIFAVEPDARPASLSAWVRELRPAVIATTTRPPLPAPPTAAPATAPSPLPLPLPVTPSPLPPSPVPPPPVHAPAPVARSAPPRDAPAPATPAGTAPAGGKRRRGLRAGLAAVVAVLLVGGGGYAGVVLSGGDGDGGHGTADGAPRSPSASGSSTTSGVSGAWRAARRRSTARGTRTRCTPRTATRGTPSTTSGARTGPSTWCSGWTTTAGTSR
jgi:serine/threonine protein kinase